MSGAAFRTLLGLMVLVAAGTVVYFRYFRPPLSCSDSRVVNTASQIVKERLAEGAKNVVLHLISTVSTSSDGVRCMASAQIQMGEGKDDDYRNIEYIAFVGKDYDSQPSDKRNFTVFANFKR